MPWKHKSLQLHTALQGHALWDSVNTLRSASGLPPWPFLGGQVLEPPPMVLAHSSQASWDMGTSPGTCGGGLLRKGSMRSCSLWRGQLQARVPLACVVMLGQQ